MRVCVTGGSGFIGSHVVDALVNAGHDVRVFDLRSGHRPDVEYRQGSLLGGDALRKATDGMEAVFHLAAPT